MKYSGSNKPLVCMQTQSTCYKGTKKMTVKGVLWHSTGANNTSLKRYVQPSDVKPPEDTYTKSQWLQVLGKNAYGNDWNHGARSAGLNCWIGKLADGTVTTVQTMPWDYRPWGCGSGSKGSCNDGWIQFEICEDGLTDATYFNKIYKEACEITAYLCHMFGIDPNGTVTVNGVKIPTILCHADSSKLGFGSNHGDVNHWFPKHGKSMATARADVAKLLQSVAKPYKLVTTVNTYRSASDAKAKKNKDATYPAGTYYIYSKYPNGSGGMYCITKDSTGMSGGVWINPSENVIQETVTKLYRVRKSKDDAKSQKGAFSSLDNAKTCCQTAGPGYHVFDSDWKIVYSYTAPVTLSSIAVTKKPNKTTYTVGDKFDATGLVVTATYSDKSTKEVTGYTTTGFNSAKAGTVTITVTFENKTSTFTVTVKEKEIVVPPTAVYDLDYPEKNKIIDKTVIRTNKDCVKAINKILSNNTSFDVEIAKKFFELAPVYGIDPMMAIAQSILETGWFKYAGSAVKAEQHNYCGLGVTSNGVTGASFDTISDGVTAQLQHLYAYGCKDELPSGYKVLDPRFNLVTRGIAIYWQQLAGRWAVPGYDKATYATAEEAMKAGNTYGQKIRALYNQLMSVTVTDDEVEKYFGKDGPAPVDPEVKPDDPQVKPDDPEVKPDDKEDKEDQELKDNASFVFKWLRKIIEALISVLSKGE